MLVVFRHSLKDEAPGVFDWIRTRLSPDLAPAPGQRLSLIVGLGNPDARYRCTRHNMGFMLIERLAEREGLRIDRKAHRALMGSWPGPAGVVLLARPQTYMNNSGDSVAAIVQYYKLERSQILVVCDESALPFGRIRLRPGGSEAGHNGLRSISARLGTREYPRLRIGIGRPPQGRELVDHVLAPFSRHELEDLPEILDRSIEAVTSLAAEGIEKAMSRFNG